MKTIYSGVFNPDPLLNSFKSCFIQYTVPIIIKGMCPVL